MNEPTGGAATDFARESWATEDTSCRAPHSTTGICGCPEFIAGRERGGWIPCVNTRPSGERCGHTVHNHRPGEAGERKVRR